jgi:periplasmic protein TonB
MVIRQPINGAIFQSFAAEAPRRRMSRGMSIAIGASLIAHVAVGIYLYNAAFNVPAVAPPDSDPITGKWLTLTPPDKSTVKPPPEKAPQQPTIRKTPPTPFTTPDNTLQADPTPPKADKTVVEPRVLTGGVTESRSDPQLIPTPKKITRPDWLSQPDAAAMSKYYPERAQRLGISGSATINCTVAANGTISGCDVVGETPSNYGFGDAARKLSRFFKMRPQMVDGQAVAGGTIEIPIQFRLSDN